MQQGSRQGDTAKSIQEANDDERHYVLQVILMNSGGGNGGGGERRKMHQGVMGYIWFAAN